MQRTDSNFQGLPLIDTALNTGCATLLDALSLAVAYPTEALVEAWRNGEFTEILDAALAQAQADASVLQAGADLAAGIQMYFSHDRQTEDVQADYVGLFELNREQPPVYLLQHLYPRETHTTQIELYKALLERYRRCGITMKQGEGALPPDQLSVQLEFVAYLFGALNQAHARPEDNDVALRRAVLADTVRMLQWIDAPIERLAQTGIQHPLYVPLLRLVRHALDLCATNTGNVD